MIRKPLHCHYAQALLYFQDEEFLLYVSLPQPFTDIVVILFIYDAGIYLPKDPALSFTRLQYLKMTYIQQISVFNFSVYLKPSIISLYLHNASLSASIRLAENLQIINSLIVC